MVAECPCEDGCPSCVGAGNMRPPINVDPDLGGAYPVPSKAATVLTLQLLSQWAAPSAAGDAAEASRPTVPGRPF